MPRRGDHTRLKDKTTRRYEAREAPFLHDMLRDLDIDRDSKEYRAIREYMRVEQENFDAMNSELRRMSRIFNEREADTHYLKERYEFHDDDSTGRGNESIQRDNDTWQRQFIPPNNIMGEGGGIITEDYITTVPFYLPKNTHVTQMAWTVGTPYDHPEVMADPIPVFYSALYAGDNPGHAPGTLLAVGGAHTGDVQVPGSQITWDYDLIVPGGSWVWHGVYQWPESRSVFDDPPFENPFFDPCINSTEIFVHTQAWVGQSTESPLFPALDTSYDEFSTLNDYQVTAWDYHDFGVGEELSDTIPNDDWPLRLPFDYYGGGVGNGSGEPQDDRWFIEGPFYTSIDTPVSFMRTE